MFVGRGEVVCIVGPSGSGKITLLNIIGGLDKPDTGVVIVDGVDVAKLSEAELTRFRLFKVGYVFQLYNLIPTLTVLENVELPMYLAGVSKDIRRKRAVELLEIVGLERYADKTPDMLSGGEQQRVAIARALANNTVVVLMDEPTGALDTENTRKLIALVKKLNRELGQTFIIATHDVLVARECTKIFTIRDGKIEGVYSPAELSKALHIQCLQPCEYTSIFTYYSIFALLLRINYLPLIDKKPGLILDSALLRCCTLSLTACFKSIGIVEDGLDRLGEQGAKKSRFEVVSVIRVFEESVEGLNGLEEYSHIIIVYWMHKADRAALKARPWGVERHCFSVGGGSQLLICVGFAALHHLLPQQSPQAPSPQGLTTSRLVAHNPTGLGNSGCFGLHNYL